MGAVTNWKQFLKHSELNWPHHVQGLKNYARKRCLSFCSFFWGQKCVSKDVRQKQIYLTETVRKFEFLSLYFRCINWGKRCDPEAKCGRNVRWMRRRQRKTLNMSNSYSRSLKGKAQTIHLNYKHVLKFIIIKLTDCLMKWSSRSKVHWVVHNLPQAPKAMSSWNSSDMQLSTWREPKSVRQPTSTKRLFSIS